MVSEVLIHKIPDPASFEDFEEVARCYYEIYSLVVFVRGDSKLMTRLDGEEVYITDDLLRRVRGSESNPFYIDVRCRVCVR